MHLVSVDFFLFYFFTYPSEKAGGFTKEREREMWRLQHAVGQIIDILFK